MSKLLAQCQGPYEVLRKVGKVNYEVLMTGRRKKKQIFHINMLCKWYVPTDNSYLAQEVTKEEGDDVVLRKEEEDQYLSGPTIGSDLSEAQKEELGDLLEEFKGTLQEEQV